MNVSDSGVKVGDFPPLMLGGIAVSFFAGFMTQWWLAMGVMGKIRDDCDINRVKSVTALLKSKAETVKNGNAARSDMLRARKCPFLCPKCLKTVKRA